jgi:hypothetical protein
MSGASVAPRWIRCVASKRQPCFPRKNNAGKTFKTIVPMHRTLAKGTLSDILKQCGLSVEQLIELL